ncbi:type II toxin-antitoxin system VapC family toxin [Desulfosoma sp.]|uniref:type II toxin-antitoxin system VapC family toxin n=2 Tax=Desulfosoma sp. TaxID=2603217 RepID=UPI00404B85FD
MNWKRNMPRKSQEKIVLDAWAVLAFLFGEQPAADAVRDIFVKQNTSPSSIYMSWINLGEVYYIIRRKKGADAADAVLDDIQLLPIKLEAPSKNDILSAAKLKARHTLSYADAFAVTLAQKIHGTLCTGDPEILLLGETFKVQPLSRTL